MPKPPIALVAGALAAALALPTLADARSTTALGSGKVTRGTVVVNTWGVTLYAFTNDRAAASACNSGCDIAWRPLAAKGSLVVKPGSGLKQSLVGKLKRADGSYQVTYAGHPLYRYTGDTKAGQQNGENKTLNGGHWYVLGAARGTLLKPRPHLFGGY